MYKNKFLSKRHHVLLFVILFVLTTGIRTKILRPNAHINLWYVTTIEIVLHVESTSFSYLAYVILIGVVLFICTYVKYHMNIMICKLQWMTSALGFGDLSPKRPCHTVAILD